MDFIGYCKPDLLTLLVNDRKRRTLRIMTMGKLMKGRELVWTKFRVGGLFKEMERDD